MSPIHTYYGAAMILNPKLSGFRVNFVTNFPIVQKREFTRFSQVVKNKLPFYKLNVNFTRSGKNLPGVATLVKKTYCTGIHTIQLPYTVPLYIILYQQLAMRNSPHVFRY